MGFRDRDILGAKADRQHDALLFLDGTPCLGGLADDRAGWLAGVFLRKFGAQQVVVVSGEKLVLRHADKADDLHIGTVGEEQVAGVCEDQVDENGSADNERHGHAEEDRQQRKAPAGIFLFALGRFATARVGRADPAGIACADICGFGAGLGTVYHAVDAPFRVVLGIAVFVFKTNGGVALELLNGIQHFLSTLIALVGVLFHCLFGDLAQTGRGVGGDLCQRLRLLGNLHDGDGHGAVTVKRQTAGEHFIQHNTDRVDVGAGIGAFSLGLLRADIVYRADSLVADGLALRAGEARNAEVHHLDGAVRQQHDVLRLDIAVDNALGMCMLQGAQHLCGKMHGFLPGQRTAALLEVFLQGDAVHIFHDDVLQLVGDRYIVDLDDVGMAEDRDGLRFVFEASDQLFIVEKFFLQNLDGDLVACFQIGAAVDIGHAANAHKPLNRVAAVQSFANQIIHC